MSERVASRESVMSAEASSDDRRQPVSVRAQSAIVRSLADALEQLSLAGDNTDALRAQLAEEVHRLHSRIEEAAARSRPLEDE